MASFFARLCVPRVSAPAEMLRWAVIIGWRLLAGHSNSGRKDPHRCPPPTGCGAKRAAKARAAQVGRCHSQTRSNLQRTSPPCAIPRPATREPPRPLGAQSAGGNKPRRRGVANRMPPRRADRPSPLLKLPPRFAAPEAATRDRMPLWGRSPRSCARSLTQTDVRSGPQAMDHNDLDHSDQPEPESQPGSCATVRTATPSA